MINRVLETRKLNKQTSKLIGSDGGSSNDAHKKAYDEITDSLVSKCEQHFLRAIYKNELKHRTESKSEIEKSLDIIKEAFWRAEDTEKEDKIHNLMHRMAQWKHDIFGCLIQKNGSGYFSRCTIAITHRKIGFSVGFTGESICSLCHKNEFECEHSTERSYWIEGGINDSAKCNICDESGCTLHDENHIYRVNPGRTIKNSILHEVSIVKKPAIPVARMQEIPISEKEIRDMFGQDIIDNDIQLKCHNCSGPCRGFTEFKI